MSMSRASARTGICSASGVVIHPAGGGFALGLRSESLRRGGGLLRRVIYDRNTQRQVLRDLLVPIVDRFASADYPADGESRDPRDWFVREHLSVVTTSLAECGFCFKHPAFEAESEWRLVILHAHDPKRRPDDPPPDIRATRPGLLPYLTRSLETDAVAKVVVGPSSQPTLAADAAAQLLSNAGYEKARDMVSHSAIPLRVSFF
jgi:hypothetical protein